MKIFPASLRAATPADGHALARRLAEFALAAPGAPPRDMAADLSVSPPPAIETLTALYFQAVAAANAGWSR